MDGVNEMKLTELKPSAGSKKKSKRVGRGESSGHGKTSGRGSKGQRSRSGGKVPQWFEGGQMPLQRRLPKRGFKNPFKKEFAIINVGDLDKFEPNTVVDREKLKEAGLVKRIKDGIKLLGNGEIERPLTVRVNKVSKSAKEKIEAAGGVVEEV